MFAKLYMGKVLVKRTNGKNFEAYIVDEDRDKYRFRWNINSPKEFSVRRVDIIHISRLEPSSLKGSAEKDRVLLTWAPSYKKAKRYNIYYKIKGTELFTLVGESNETRYTLYNLKNDEEYSVVVKAVDLQDNESGPSNLIIVSTYHLKFQNHQKIYGAKPYTVRIKNIILHI